MLFLVAGNFLSEQTCEKGACDRPTCQDRVHSLSCYNVKAEISVF